MIKEVHEIEEIIDFVWELSQDDLYAGYPRKKNMKELKDSIQWAMEADNESIIACYDKDSLRGVCIYHWDHEEKYAQTTQLLIKEDYDKVADELIAYIRAQLSGYTFLVPIPFTNKNANEYLIRRGFECVDANIDTRLYNFELSTEQKNQCVEIITKDNFQEYAVFHDKYAIPSEMYYHSKNVQKEMERFLILAYREHGAIHGGIVVKVVGELSEIFAVFIDEEYEHRGIEAILINEIIGAICNEFTNIKELIYFIDEDDQEELNIVLNSGFVIEGRPRTYKFLL